MISAIISIGQVQGGEIWLSGWLLCAALYFVFLLIQKVNRSRTGAINVVVCFLISEALIDLGCCLLRQPRIHSLRHCRYLWPFLLLAAESIASAQTRKTITPFESKLVPWTGFEAGPQELEPLV